MPIQVLQSQEQETLEEWQDGVMGDFMTILDYHRSEKHTDLPFEVDGTKYRCLRRIPEEGNNELWIRPVDWNVQQWAVFDVKTKTLIASLCFEPSELVKLMPCLSA